ncbi:HDOD domain-containing protein [Desulfobacter hydrogenophilus]|uniref:HDOD domain-containing protein n=1 Tax=Desulfobacter hydrogenophilus TaxID=2291 RepID=A0A328FAM1_9BACT|nr:HDOD domain-containing protein [Desulfobacter hydrogenophilus]NDY73359.1 HDOD domain-containing protein [Desulfobacter hydrogenophilus]QBH14036.1 HDOD domain-containing protein [Desulfobacter hydrogenophilus]RAM01598.1 HDOD domain-containing protein [Desulfobacter hydrogenophilus]
MTNFQEMAKEIKNLTPIPAVTMSLLKVVDDPNKTMDDVTNIIQYDPAITADVLRIANSAYFGLKYPAETISDAANMLGTDRLVEFVLLKVASKIIQGPLGGYDMHEGALWQHSVSSAIIAKQLALQLGLPHSCSIFTAALLKDIGKTVMDKYVKNAYKKIYNLVINENFSFMEAEKKVIGVDHAELGGMMAHLWKFSPKMVMIITNHHLSREDTVKDKDTIVVYIADCICMMMGMGVGADGMAYRFHQQAIEQIGISADDIVTIIANVIPQMKEVAKLLKMF